MAAVFPDSGPIQDIDCHVILKRRLTDRDIDAVLQLHRDLARRFPPLGAELDAFVILREDARETHPPDHQLQSDIRDQAWALHCAHIRAGRFFALHGPPPKDIFPAPSRDDISAALEHEVTFIEQNLRYPDYCVLNMCRIIYSVQERNVVVSKFSSGAWARDRYPEWKPLINATLASYNGTVQPDEVALLKREVESFVEFGKALFRNERQPG